MGRPRDGRRMPDKPKVGCKTIGKALWPRRGAFLSTPTGGGSVVRKLQASKRKPKKKL